METSIESAKAQTIHLYESLPQDKQQRMSRLDVRDKIIELNYTFFGYIASHTFINNSSVTYEDKLQSALMHFCECWWWYKWAGDETHKGYRGDVSFTSFFKLRVAEMIERELNEVKYSIRRSLCMEVGEQLHKHWGQVKYEDLAHVTLPANKMITLKAIFGTLYTADLADHETYIASKLDRCSELDDPNTDFSSIVDLLVHDMIVYEEKLTPEKLEQMSEIYGINVRVLSSHVKEAEDKLYRMIKDEQDISESWDQ